MLSVIMLSVILLSVIMLTVIMLSVIMLCVTLKPFMPSAVMLTVIMLRVVAPSSLFSLKERERRIESLMTSPVAAVFVEAYVGEAEDVFPVAVENRRGAVVVVHLHLKVVAPF
jgi:hypothetical protein